MSDGPDIKIGANIDDARRDIERLTAQLNKMGQAAAKATQTKFNPINPKDLGDVKRLEDLWKQIAATQRGVRTAVAASGQNPGDLWSADLSKVAFTHAQQRGLIMRFLQGTGAYQGQFARNSAPAPGGVAAGVHAAVSRFMSGASPGGASIFNRAATGATEGGGAAGFLRGGLIGAGLLALFKGGKMVAQGYESAKEQGQYLDNVKMRMGSLGVSFSMLQSAATIAAHGMLINSKESAALFKEFNQLSGGVKTVTDLMGSVRSSVGFGAGFGIDSRHSASFFATERQYLGGGVGGSRRLAVMIGDAIASSGITAKSDQVLEAIKEYTVITARASLSRVNVSPYVGSMASIMKASYPGMSVEGAAGLLSTANSAIMGLSGGGVNAQAFALAALQRQGSIDPIQAQILLSGGMFATRASTFKEDGPYYQFMKKHGMTRAALARLVGKHGNVTNFESMMGLIQHMGVNPELQLSMIQRLFHLANPQAAAVLANLNPKSGGALMGLLKSSGISLNHVNMSGISTLSGIANAGTMAALGPLIASMRHRHMIGGGDEAGLKVAEGRGLQATKEFLAKLAAAHGREQTTASKQLEVTKALDTTMTRVGNKIYEPLVAMKFGILKMSGLNSPKSMESAIVDARSAAIREQYDRKIKDAEKHDKIWDFYPHLNKIRAERDAKIKAMQAQVHAETQAMYNADVPGAVPGTGTVGHTVVHHHHTTDVNIQLTDKHGKVAGSHTLTLHNGAPQPAGAH